MGRARKGAGEGRSKVGERVGRVEFGETKWSLGSTKSLGSYLGWTRTGWRSS